MDIETDNLRCRRNAFGRDVVYLLLRSGEVYLGMLESAIDGLPHELEAEFEELVDKVADADRAGRGYDATRRDADSMRHYPGDWQ